jgi:Arc/MetJ-type ribon-helix-helix transcriptional regulator
MSIQIAVRLDDEVVHWVDEAVAHGEASGRAALIERALRRERRRMTAERDAEIYATSTDPELAAIVKATSNRPLDID